LEAKSIKRIRARSRSRVVSYSVGSNERKIVSRVTGCVLSRYWEWHTNLLFFILEFLMALFHCLFYSAGGKEQQAVLEEKSIVLDVNCIYFVKFHTVLNRLSILKLKRTKQI
jgi:hypothetical protein